MRLRRRAPVVVCSLLSCAISDVAVAQEAQPEATLLPPVVVETEQAPKVKAKTKTKKKPSTAAASIPAQQPAPAPQPTGMPRTSNGTAYGPVGGYAAESTATGIKTNTPLKEIPQSISVVGTEQMRDQGVQTLSDALRYVPGVVAESFGLDSRTDGQFMRGTKPAQFLDGLRSNFNEFYYGYRAEPYFMERIEVLRGPSSVLYGQAPVGGIINAVSKRPHGDAGGEITFEYGTFDFKQMKFDTSGLITTDGQWSYRVAGVGRLADTQVDYVNDDRFAIQPAITWRPDSDTTITLLGEFQRDRTAPTQQNFPRIGTLYPNPAGRYIPRNRLVGEPDDYYDTDVAAGTLLVEHRFNSWLKLNHASRYADVHNEYDAHYNTDWNYTFDFAKKERVGIRAHDTAVNDAQTFNQDTNIEAKFATGALSHRVLGGIDYAHFDARRAYTSGLVVSPLYFDLYNPVYGTALEYTNTLICGLSTNDKESCRDSQTMTQTGLYVQDQIRIGNWIGVVGVRKDWVENDTVVSNRNGYGQFAGKLSQVEKKKDDAVTYRAGLMYEFAFGLTPYISYGESFVPQPGTWSPANGGKPFDPQTGRMYEVGFKYQPDGADFAINGAVFDIADTGRLVGDPASTLYQRQLGDVSIKGFEIEATGQLTQNLKIVGGYSYTQAEYEDNQGAHARGNQLESMPKHLASLWGVWEFDQPELKGWSVGGGARYIGDSWDETNTTKTPSVTLYDAMIAYENETWRWQLTGHNLEDKYYVSTCIARGDCWIGSARTVITGLTYKY